MIWYKRLHDSLTPGISYLIKGEKCVFSLLLRVKVQQRGCDVKLLPY